MRLKIITFVSIVTQNNVSQSVFIETTLHLIVSCVFQYSHGLVGVRTSTNMEQFRRPLVVVYYKLDFTGKRKKETSYWRNRFALHTCSLVVSVLFLCIVFISVYFLVLFCNYVMNCQSSHRFTIALFHSSVSGHVKWENMRLFFVTVGLCNKFASTL